MAFKKEIVEIIEPRDVFVGNPKAEVTLEEFGEYESEVCAKANEVVKELLEKYEGKIRFNFRHFPLTKIHQRSLKAGEAAVATAQEGKFWEMHNILFANRRNLGTTSLKLHSKEAGVKSKKFLDDLVNATYGWQVQGDLKEGINRGVKDVPAFFVNGNRIPGNPTFEELSKAIDTALKQVSKKGAPVASKKIPASTKPEAEVKTAPKTIVKPVAKSINPSKPSVKVVPQKSAKKAANIPSKVAPKGKKQSA